MNGYIQPDFVADESTGYFYYKSMTPDTTTPKIPESHKAALMDKVSVNLHNARKL